MSEHVWFTDEPDGPMRRDGVHLRKGLGSEWVIIAPNSGMPPLDYCPCCGALMTTVGNAMRVADTVYPLSGIAPKRT